MNQILKVACLWRLHLCLARRLADDTRFRAFWGEGFEVQGPGGQLGAPTLVGRATSTIGVMCMFTCIDIHNADVLYVYIFYQL